MGKRRRTFKWILTALVALFLFALAAVFIQMRRHQPKSLPLPAAAVNALLSVARPHQTATKDGKPQWELNAESAELEAESGRMILKAPKVLFYLANGEKAQLTADTGVLDTHSNDMQVTGHVQLRSQNYLLTGEALVYHHQSRVLQSDVPVTISGDAFNLRADKMLYNLNQNTTFFEGAVEGNLKTNARF